MSMPFVYFPSEMKLVFSVDEDFSRSRSSSALLHMTKNIITSIGTVSWENISGHLKYFIIMFTLCLRPSKDMYFYKRYNSIESTALGYYSNVHQLRNYVQRLWFSRAAKFVHTLRCGSREHVINFLQRFTSTLLDPKCAHSVKLCVTRYGNLSVRYSVLVFYFVYYFCISDYLG